jgi:hypothetical protein
LNGSIHWKLYMQNLNSTNHPCFQLHIYLNLGLELSNLNFATLVLATNRAGEG